MRNSSSSFNPPNASASHLAAASHSSDSELFNLDRLVKLPEALAITGKGRSSFLQGVADGQLPAPVRIGTRAVAWKLSELSRWLHTRPRVLKGGVA